MNLICSYSLVVASFLSFFFIGHDNSYSVLLPEGMALVQIDSLAGNTVNYTFIGKDQRVGFEYTLSFSIVESTQESLLSTEKISSYEKSCSCQIVKNSNIEFVNFKGVKYLIEKEQDGVKLGGVVYFSDESNGKRINIVSMTLTDSKDKISKAVEPILNTLVLNLK